METPPREKHSSTVAPRQLHARLKMQMENEMEIEDSNPELERMDEVPVHTGVLKPIADDFDDDDLE
jgi:hypothetical protein